MNEQTTQGEKLSSSTGGGVPLTYVIALVPVASVLNVIGGTVAGALKLPIFLDMIGTAVVAMTLGPWWGSLVGVITNLTMGFISGPVSIPSLHVTLLVHLFGVMEQSGDLLIIKLNSLDCLLLLLLQYRLWQLQLLSLFLVEQQDMLQMY